MGGKAQGFFTVGVIVDKIGVLTSQKGKKFTILKLSDLTKYDMNRVKSHLAKEYTKDEESLKIAQKSYNSDGYKTVSVMAFNDCALPAKQILSGTVVALINPRLMPPSNSSEKA